MTKKFLQLYRNEEDFHTELDGLSIALSPSFLHFLKWNNKNEIDITLGNRSLTVKVFTHSFHKQDIIFSPELANELRLPSDSKSFLIPYSEMTSLILGPVIGIITEINSSKNEVSLPSLQSFCEELKKELINIGGFFYICGLQDFHDDYVNGFYLEDGTWKNLRLPYPQVMYNRLHSRHTDASSTFQNIKSDLAAKNIPIFNSRFFSKLEIYDLLKEFPQIQAHLPVTAKLSKQSLFQMLDTYSTIYIKPIHGSLGRNIIHLQVNKNEYQTMLSTGKNKGKKRVFHSKEKLWEWITSHAQKRSYICQQGIDLLKWNDCTLDYRILCHKNADLLWNTTSIVGRIAPKESFVANLAQGAEMKSAKSLLEDLFGLEEARKKLESMKGISLEVAHMLSNQTHGLLGELGIDIGLDGEGNIWIIEVNSKPSKKIQDQLEKRKPSTKALIEYFITLAFFPEIKEHEADE